MDQSCQLQPTSFCSDANETVAQQAASSAGRTDDNNAHSMNNGEWTHEKKNTKSLYRLRKTAKRK